MSSNTVELLCWQLTFPRGFGHRLQLTLCTRRIICGTLGGHVLQETTSRGLCGLVCPSRTSERGGEGYCVKGGGGEEGERERERAREVRLHYSLGYSG
jgi:hypothetical protein